MCVFKEYVPDYIKTPLSTDFWLVSDGKIMKIDERHSPTLRCKTKYAYICLKIKKTFSDHFLSAMNLLPQKCFCINVKTSVFTTSLTVMSYRHHSMMQTQINDKLLQ